MLIGLQLVLALLLLPAGSLGTCRVSAIKPDAHLWVTAAFQMLTKVRWNFDSKCQLPASQTVFQIIVTVQ